VTLELSARTVSLPFRDPFRIARSHGDGTATTVLVELRSTRRPGLVGLGEGFPDAFYGETPETVHLVASLLAAAVQPLEDALLEGSLADARAALVDAGAAMTSRIRWNGAAKCGLDIALHDLAGRRADLPVHALLGGATRRRVPVAH
jgi:L-alanine-DL-glutamate epimerase-like enolase superfamily enzyme